MYISKKFKWTKSFIDEVVPMFPKLKKVKKLNVVRSSFTTRDRFYGQITETDNKFNITIRHVYQYIDFYPLSITLKPLSKIDILATLAHELAHVYHWNHSPEHKLLENQILNIFMFKLKSDGYKDEETELGEVQ